MIFFQDTKRLTNEVIGSWTEEAVKAYQENAGKRAESTVKLRLTIEELLLRYRDLYGTDEPCSIKGVRRFGGCSFELSQKGMQQNPLDIDTESSISYNLLARLNLNPHYAYRQNRGLNVVTIPAPLKKRKNATLIGILLAAVLSVVTWLVSGILPEAVRNDYMIPLVSGLFSKLSSIFSAIATPLVFCAVMSGISGIGDVSSFGKLGGRLLKRMMASYGICMLAMLAIGLPMGLVSSTSATNGGNVFSDLLNLVLDIIPGNLIEPFRIDNDLQVIVIAVFVWIVPWVWSMFSPFIIAIPLAAVLQPLIGFLQKKLRFKRGLASLIVVLSVPLTAIFAPVFAPTLVIAFCRSTSVWSIAAILPLIIAAPSAELIGIFSAVLSPIELIATAIVEAPLVLSIGMSLPVFAIT